MARGVSSEMVVRLFFFGNILPLVPLNVIILYIISEQILKPSQKTNLKTKILKPSQKQMIFSNFLV